LYSRARAGTIGLAVFALLQIRAADTALRVAERAYITVGSPVFDPATKFLTFSLSNYGHIPSGKIEIRQRDRSSRPFYARSLGAT
jgi:hypothetical protein